MFTGAFSRIVHRCRVGGKDEGLAFQIGFQRALPATDDLSYGHNHYTGTVVRNPPGPGHKDNGQTNNKAHFEQIEHILYI